MIIEYLKAYKKEELPPLRSKEFGELNIKYPYSSSVLYPLNCAVFFKTEADMIAFDNCHNIPPLNYQHVVDRGLNLHARVKQLNAELYD